MTDIATLLRARGDDALLREAADEIERLRNKTGEHMRLNVKKLHPNAKLPTYATPGSACFDLYCIDDGHIAGSHTGVFQTGLAVEVPNGHVMLVFSRSGHGFNHNVRLSNCVGVIDSDYRGEVKVKLAMDGGFNPLKIKAGDRIAQAMIVPYPKVALDWVDELSDTERGEGGMGSTGS